MASKIQTADSMLGIDDREIRVGDRVAYVTSGYSHQINFRVGTVSKIRVLANGKRVASVKYDGRKYDYVNKRYENVICTSAMQTPRIVKIG
jgi:hypothetical protein